jgi:GAF domain
MRSPKQIVTAWLDRPQVTNREALTVAIVGSFIWFALLWVSGQALDAADAVDFGDTIKLWLAAVIAGATLAFGLVIGARKGRQVPVLEKQISGLEARAQELGGYTVYAEHLRDALADLRRFLDGELPAFSLRDFIENGLFEPAQRLLARGHSGSDLRFSVLHPDGDEFVMSRENDLFPALGHTVEGRKKFRMPIDESFSGHAFRQRKVFASGKLSEDDRFTPHPQAKRPYESSVSIPLWADDDVDGVLNVVSTEADAFNAVDRSYLALIGSVLDVARATMGDDEPEEMPSELPPEHRAH